MGETFDQAVLPTGDDPWEVLGVEKDDGPDAVRAAYMRRVSQFPPDRNGEAFRRIRAAYEYLNEPRHRAARVIAVDPGAPLTDILEKESDRRHFVGPGPWLAALREVTT